MSPGGEVEGFIDGSRNASGCQRSIIENHGKPASLQVLRALPLFGFAVPGPWRHDGPSAGAKEFRNRVVASLRHRNGTAAEKLGKVGTVGFDHHSLMFACSNAAVADEQTPSSPARPLRMGWRRHGRLEELSSDGSATGGHHDFPLTGPMFADEPVGRRQT